MKAKFRSNQSPTPCNTCKHLKKGQAGISCNKKGGSHYITFEKYRGRPTIYETACRSHKAMFYIYKCISLHQPWAWAIISAGKDIENRTMNWRHRGEFLVHAARIRVNNHEWEEFQNYFDQKFSVTLPEIDQINFGGIVGKAKIIDCVTESKSPWFETGKKGWVLKDQASIKFIPVPGQQGIFHYQSEVKL